MSEDLHALPTKAHGSLSPEAPTLGLPGGAAPAATELPGYEILGELGRGGMGVVYKARQVTLDRVVAVKMILAGTHASAEAVARFQHEALTVARLQHPNIVQIHEVGTHAGHSYLVLEHVEGGTLAMRTAGVAQPPREAARLVETLARAVAFAHEHGIVHRDLKPGNVLLTPDGVPRITDFGLATEIARKEHHLTATGAIIGTPGYMSPEQASDRGIPVGPPADVWALGAILYTLLTGRPPFQASTPVETILQTLTDDPVPPSRLRSSAPRDLDTVCLKCLRKEPAQRYASAGELADDLRRFLADQPVKARPVGLGERFLRWARRHPGVAALLATVQLALLALVVLGVWSNRRVSGALHKAERALDDAVLARDEADRHRTDAEKARDSANAARVQAEQSRDAAVAETYRARFSETQALRLAGQSGWRLQALSKLHELAGLATPQRDLVTLRSEAVACVGGFDAVLVQRLIGHRIGVWSLDFSPDGSLLATQDAQETRLWDVAEGRYVRGWRDNRSQPDRLFAAAGPFPSLRFRPGTRTFVKTNWSGSLSWLDADGRAAIGSIRSSKPGYPRCLSYDARGQLLAASWLDGRISLHDAASGALRREFRPQKGWSWDSPVALSPDGHWVASAGDAFRVLLYPAGGGAPVVLGRHRDVVRYLAFSPDGKVVASCSNDMTIRLTPADAPEGTISLTGHTARIARIAFSPDGSLLASVSDDRSLRIWEARTGRQMIALRPNVGPLLSVAFSPDGTHVAAGSGDVVVYRLGSRLEQRRLRGHTYMINDVAFHPSKPVLASGSADRSARLWQLPEGQVVRSWSQARNNPVGRVAFSPDGKVLACAVARFGEQPAGDQGVDLFDPETGKTLARLSGPTEVLHALDFSPDGKRLAGGGVGGEVFVWDVTSRQVLHSWVAGKGNVTGLAFASPDELIVSSWGEGVRRMALRDGTVLRRASVTSAIIRQAFSSKANLVAAAAQDGTIHLLNPDDLTSLGTLKGGHDAEPFGLAFSPDGRLLASGGPRGSGYGTALWDVRQRALVLRLPSLNAVHSVAFDRDGLLLAIAGVDEQVTLWNLALVRPELVALGLDWDERGQRRRPVPAAPTVQVVKAPAFAPAVPALTRRPGREAEDLRVLASRSRLAPGDRELLLALARAQKARGQYSDAADSCDGHLKLCKDCPTALVEKGECLVAQGKRAEATAVYQRLQTIHPSRAEPCYQLALLYSAAKAGEREREQALLLARRAVALAPNDVSATLALAVVYLRSGQDEQAVQLLAKVPAGKTLAHSLARLHLAGCLNRLGKGEEAGRAFDEAAPWWHDPALHPQAVADWRATRKEVADALGRNALAPARTLSEREARGRALARIGHWNEARSDLEEAVKGKPGDVGLLELAGRACAHSGHPDRAAELLGRALDGQKISAEATLLRSDIAGWPETFERLAKSRPDDWRLRLARGQRHALRNEWEEAERHYPSVPPDQLRGGLLVERAALLLLLGERKRYERLIADQPDPEAKDVGSMLWLVWAASLGQKPGASEERLKALVERIGKVPLVPRPTHAVGMARLRLGKAGEVVKSVKALPADRQDTAGLNLYLLALAHQAEGQPEEARKVRTQAEQWLAARRPAEVEPSPAAVDWLTLELMRREAEDRIQQDRRE